MLESKRSFEQVFHAGSIVDQYIRLVKARRVDVKGAEYPTTLKVLQGYATPPKLPNYKLRNYQIPHWGCLSFFPFSAGKSGGG
jgi:hypothetical protein